MFQGWQATYDGLTVLGVHPVAPVDPAGLGRSDHRAILEAAEDADADLIVGDINATPDHDVMRNLDDAGFRDAGELANEGWQPTWPANHVGDLPVAAAAGPDRPRARRRPLASLGTQTVDIDGTDHLALVAVPVRPLVDRGRRVLPLVRRLGAARPARASRR